MPRIPNTIHGLNPFLCISALQKYVRRGMEREAQEIAAEMFYTSKAYASWVCKRLEVISHEDVGLAAPHLIPLVRTCCEQAREWYDAKKQGRGASVMAVGTAIRRVCRAPKSREGDHFHCAVGMPLLIEDRVRSFPTGCSTSTPRRAALPAAASITSAKYPRCSTSRRRRKTLTKMKPIGCGSSKRARTRRPFGEVRGDHGRRR